MSTLPSRSVVETTAEAIAFRIASGKYPAGERLPSVRGLAAEFGINPSTVQVVLAHLQAAGFVTSHAGLGLIVRDIYLYGDIPTWRYIFRFAQQLPDRAVKILEDLLEMRLVLIAEAITKIASTPDRFDPAPVRAAVEQMRMLVQSSPNDRTAIARAELHATRLLMLSVRQSVVTAVLNSIGSIYLDVPAVIEAMYAEPKLNLAVWDHFLQQWERKRISPKIHAQLEGAFRQYDTAVMQRFRRAVEAGAARRAS